MTESEKIQIPVIEETAYSHVGWEKEIYSRFYGLWEVADIIPKKPLEIKLNHGRQLEIYTTPSTFGRESVAIHAELFRANTTDQQLITEAVCDQIKLGKGTIELLDSKSNGKIRWLNQITEKNVDWEGMRYDMRAMEVAKAWFKYAGKKKIDESELNLFAPEINIYQLDNPEQQRLIRHLLFFLVKQSQAEPYADRKPKALTDGEIWEEVQRTEIITGMDNDQYFKLHTSKSAFWNSLNWLERIDYRIRFYQYRGIQDNREGKLQAVVFKPMGDYNGNSVLVHELKHAADVIALEPSPTREYEIKLAQWYQILGWATVAGLAVIQETQLINQDYRGAILTWMAEAIPMALCILPINKKEELNENYTRETEARAYRAQKQYSSLTG